MQKEFFLTHSENSIATFLVSKSQNQAFFKSPLIFLLQHFMKHINKVIRSS